MKLFIILIGLVPCIAQAHPGHGETLHSHPELWVVIVLVAAALTYFRREVA